MKLYIDESGNTGETLIKNGKPNFNDQPYYVLAGLLISDSIKSDFISYIQTKKTESKIQSPELKAKNIYEKQSGFIIDIVNYITTNNIPVFIELMDKHFYLNIQILEHIIVPSYSLPLTNKNMQYKNILASNITPYLSDKIYEQFVIACKEYNAIELEKLFQIFLTHFSNTNNEDLKKNIELTIEDYNEKKAKSREAYKSFLPIPDKNPKNRLIHLLPNYQAFTGLVGRVEKHRVDFKTEDYEIVHDEQKQFDIIYKAAFDLMKENDTDGVVANTIISERAIFNINKDLKLEFVDSKQELLIQISDLISGFVMRFWKDFSENNSKNVSKYCSTFKKLTYPVNGATMGINFVVPDLEHMKYVRKASSQQCI